MNNYSDSQIRYLIDYANIKQGLIKNQNDFLSDKDLQKFLKKKYLGFPLLLPLGIKYFDYSGKIKQFKISKKNARKYIFNCKSNDYVGMKIFFKYGNKFCVGAKLKKKYEKDYYAVINFNKKLISQIKNKKKKFKISSFQTRNIPHFGHELIIQKLIGYNKLLFINPLIGIKKKGDVKNYILEKVFNYLKNLNIYKSRIIYGPVICNMHYAGPREALHHVYIREKLGFDQFSIGRDHAGAEDNFKPLDAKTFVKKNNKRFKINIFYHNGAYFCRKCKKIILKGDCNHKSLNGISGSEFRKKLEKKIVFLYARKNLQKFINKIKKKNLFN
ncbi:hypothetical protein OAJ20_04205 [Candidatus Pelagibacter sp.]|nr:hypothetical protein [Candidatus Pelagibacter sp.]